MEELPGLIIATLILFFVVRYFYNRSSSSSVGSTRRAGTSEVLVDGVPVTVDASGAPLDGPLKGVSNDMITTVHQAFPHISTSSIVYSLSRTKSAQITSEEILERGFLAQAPAGFPKHPYIARQELQAANAAPVTASSNPITTPSATPTPSLIERYGLSNKVQADLKGKGKAVEEQPSQTQWESSAAERQAKLNKRKEEMILAARRKMLEKTGANSTSSTVATAGKSFIFVTGNSNKLREVKAILDSGGSGIEVTNQAVDVPEVQGTTQEVAIAKCKAAAEKLGAACVTEDTALCFEALNDLPGPYIKDFLGKLGHDGLNALLEGFSSKRAYALCTFAYAPPPTAEDPHPQPILFEGKTYGQIVPPRGPTHFGWDCIFQPDEGDGKTYAEMDGAAKNAISHRYRALELLKAHLMSQ